MIFPKLLIPTILIALSPQIEPHQTAVARLEKAASAIGARDLRSIEYSGTAVSYWLGQSPTPNAPWPEAPNNPIGYTALINYETSSRRLEKVRGQGGRERRGVQAVVERVAWDEIGAIVRPAAFAADERWLQIWVTPHGFVQAGLSSNPRLVAEASGIAPSTEISFLLNEKFHVRGWIDSQNLVRQVDTWIGDSEGYFGVMGDLLIETFYSEYQEFQGFRFPTRIVQNWGGYPFMEITVEEVVRNPPVDIQVPDSIREGTAEPFPFTAQIEPLAEGVWYLTGTLWHSIAVEFDKHLVVIEAPFSQDRSIAVINELQRTVPGKPIKYVINTHHHFDHSGGLRVYAAHGATIITHEINRQFFEQAFSAPRTLVPDLLARSGMRLELHTFSDELVLADETRTLELYHLSGSQHATGMVMAYLPAEKLLIEADVFNPPPPGTPIPSPLDPEVLNLVRNIQVRSLNVEQIVPLHGQPVAMADLLKASGPEK